MQTFVHEICIFILLLQNNTFVNSRKLFFIDLMHWYRGYKAEMTSILNFRIFNVTSQDQEYPAQDLVSLGKLASQPLMYE